MALLTRYFQLNDAEDTQVFNFVVTKAVTRDFSRDVKSKDFVYRWHRWALSFSREDKERKKRRQTAKPSSSLSELKKVKPDKVDHNCLRLADQPRCQDVLEAGKLTP